jgi:hypothetical protein
VLGVEWSFLKGPIRHCEIDWGQLSLLTF